MPVRDDQSTGGADYQDTTVLLLRHLTISRGVCVAFGHLQGRPIDDCHGGGWRGGKVFASLVVDGNWCAKRVVEEDEAEAQVMRKSPGMINYALRFYLRISSRFETAFSLKERYRVRQISVVLETSCGST